METKPYEMVEAFWNNWSHSLTLLTSAGKQMEQITIDTLKQQQEAFNKITEGMETIEQEIKQNLAQINTQYTEYVKQFAGEPFSRQFDEWQEKWNEFSQQIQHISLSPTKTSFSVLSQTNEQFEEAIQQFIAQNQQQREDVTKQVESFLQELRAMQLDLIKKVEEGSKQLFPSMK
jgi:polyhydroxyalkanoic acid inclusion protein PhaP